MLSTQVAIRIMKNGGITFDPRTLKAVTAGFALSPYKRHERIIPCAEFSAVSIRKFMQDNQVLLALQDHYLGAWCSAGRIYLDVSVVVRDRAYAEELARAADQLAFFDLETFEEIKVEEKREEVAE